MRLTNGLVFPANSLLANTSASEGLATALTFKDSGETAYAGTLSNWQGTTPPSGTVTAFYRYVQIGKRVDLWLWIRYTTGGTGITGVDITLPSDAPVPFDLQFNSSTNSLVLYPGSLNTTLAITNSGKAAIVRSGTNAYKIIAASPAQNYANIQINITYLTT